MKELITKKLNKQIISIVIILMLCNFIMPNYSYAVSTEGGGSAIKAIMQFVCTIPDSVIYFLQNMFVTEQSIIPDSETYKIKYSPGVIFSGRVPVFNINFINPKGQNEDIYEIGENYAHSYDYEIAVMQAVPRIVVDLGYKIIDSSATNAINSIYNEVSNFDPEEAEKKNTYPITNTEYTINEIKYVLHISGIADDRKVEFFYADEEDLFWDQRTLNLGFHLICGYSEEQLQEAINIFKKDLEDHFGATNNTGEDHSENIKNKLLEKKDELYGATVSPYEISIKFKNANNQEQEVLIVNSLEVGEDYRFTIGTKVYKQASDSEFQKIISTWYNALRRIALVGLLSVLVYLGIRIVLSSSSAKDKAKYKNMLKDWLVALCLLFALHYLMNIIIIVVDKLNEVFRASVIGASGEDVLMSTVRNYIAQGDNWANVCAYVVIYFVLGVYTVIFTIQYLRRVIYLAFLTMIAPLITLTYPLDKIKDKKAQAFDMWLKDYIFFSLLQVLHLLIYYIFLGSALDLTNQGNWIYAIVAIGFMTKAEKIMKKMFGFEKSKSMGALAAGATGALVMNAINKMGSKASKGGKSGGSSNSGNTSNKVRTANANSLATLSTAGAMQAVNSSAQQIPDSNPQEENLERTSIPANNSNNTSGTGAGNGRGDSFKAGAKKVGRKAKRVFKGSKKVVGRYFRPVASATIGAGLGVTGAMIGFASGVAQGDVSGALKGVTIGGIAGNSLGRGAVNAVANIPKATEEIKKEYGKVRETYRQGYYGEEYSDRVKLENDYKNSSAYIELRKRSDLRDEVFDKKVFQMLDSGITDTKKMEKILKNNEKHPRKYSMDRAIKYSKMAEKCSIEVLQDEGRFIRFCQDQNIKISEEELEKLRKSIMDFK